MSSLATVDSASKATARPRAQNDFYREPAWAVRGLLDVQTFTAPVWDPACGKGTIPTVFRETGITCFGTDIVDRGYDQLRAIHDFTQGGVPGGVPNTWTSIVSNPPFNLAEAFLRMALAMAYHKVAFLQRLSWIEGQRRRWIWDTTPIAAVHPFACRVSMPPGDLDVPAKGGAVAFAWFVFDKGWPRGMPPIIRRIERGPS